MQESTKPFFSIIIPTYNSEKVLACCLGSILAQEYQDYEVLVVDGASQDSTLSIVESYQAQFSSLVLQSEPDQGVYDAMNKGVQLAQGQWLYFLGSDDRLYDTHVLSNVFSFVNESEFDIVYGDVFSALHQGRYAGAFTYDDLTRQNICHQAIFFKKEIFDVIGLFNLKYKSASDWDHNIKWFLSSKLLHGYMNIIVAYFADGGLSATHKDFVFERDKNYKFLKSGYFKLPFPTLKRLCEWEIEKAKESGSYVTIIFLKCYYFSLRFRRKFKLFPRTV